MPDINIKADVKQTSTLGKVKVMVEQVVGQPSQEAINTAVAAYISAHPGSLAPLSAATKAALLQIAEKVAYIDENGESYYNALYAALTSQTVVSITAVYTQSGNVYTSDSLNSLKNDLVVTAYYDDSTSADVTSACTLSGELTVGTSTITATYQEMTATFTVTVLQGLPSEYTQYDYIQTKANSGQISTTAAQRIETAAYADLSALSCEFWYETLSGHYAGNCIFGRRTASGSGTSYAFYQGSAVMGYHLHGNDSTPTIAAAEDVLHHVKFTNTTASPSTIQVDNGEPVSVVWSNTNSVSDVGFTLLANPYNTTSSFNLSYLFRIGRIILSDLSGTVVGDYIPCVRTADNVIGIYDLIAQQFHTCSTVAAATIDNSAQKYIVGNWS